MIIKIKYRIIAAFFAVLTGIASFMIISYVFAKSPEIKGEGRQIPILMYHQLLNDASRHGKYITSPETFEADIKYMKSQGFESVSASEVIDYVNGKGQLPDKPYMITFDDGFETMLFYLLPVLKKYDEKAIVSVVGSYCDTYSQNGVRKNLSYANLSWDECSMLEKSGYIEIENHSYDLHSDKSRSVMTKTSGQSQTEYNKLLTDDIMLNHTKIKSATGSAPVCFTYPFGYYTKDSESLIKSLGYKMSLSCEEGITRVVKSDPSTLFLMKRFNRPDGIETERFLSGIIKQLG